MNKTTGILLLLGATVIAIGGWTYLNYTKYAPETYITETKAEEIKPEETKPVTTETTNTVESTPPAPETVKAIPPEEVNPTVTTVNTTTGETTPGAPMFTMAQISTHTDATSCYTVINGGVYDLTMWVNMHPGGKPPILSLCGKDGTTGFMNKHKGAEKFMTVLARFKIGLLTQ